MSDHELLQRGGEAAQREPAHATAGSAVAPCVLKRAWIELCVRWRDETPAPDVAYRVVDAWGHEHRGRVDAEGLGRVEQIPDGDCTVSLPDAAGDDDEEAAAPQALATGRRHTLYLGPWDLVELEPVTDDDEPPPDEPGDEEPQGVGPRGLRSHCRR